MIRDRSFLISPSPAILFTNRKVLTAGCSLLIFEA